MFGSTEYDNECVGCIYDIAPSTDSEIKELLSICINCKRAMKPEYKDEYEDLYVSK